MEVSTAHQIALQAVNDHYSLQKVHELTFILSLIEPHDVTVEIGCDAGGTSWAIQQATDRYIGIDLPGEQFSSGLAWQGTASSMIWGNSHAKETKEQLVQMITGESIDILFIDGDHTYAGIADDFRMYAKLCTGLVVFHDIVKHQDPSVQVGKFFDEIKFRYPHTSYVAPYDTTWGGVGVLDLSNKGRLYNAIQKTRPKVRQSER